MIHRAISTRRKRSKLVLPRASTRANQGGPGFIVGPCMAPSDVQGVLPVPDEPDCSVEATMEPHQMFAMIMKPRIGKKPPVVEKIVILDDDYAKDGFDVTDAIKRPDILLGQAEDHLRLLQDQVRGEIT